MLNVKKWNKNIIEKYIYLIFLIGFIFLFYVILFVYIVGYLVRNI